MSSKPIDENAALGVATMDHEHALELKMVRELQAALRASDLAAATELLGRLDDFTSAHFLAEQLLMRLHSYPGYEAHQQQHDRLIADLRALRARIVDHELAEPADEVARLETWLTAHMASDDEALTKFLRSPAAALHETP